MTGRQKLDGRLHVVIENVQPEIDAGRFPIKRVIGRKLAVQADTFTDSHAALFDFLPQVMKVRSCRSEFIRPMASSRQNKAYEFAAKGNSTP